MHDDQTDYTWLREQEKIDQLSSFPLASHALVFKVPMIHEDCKRGKPGYPTKCAIAVAIKRLLPEAKFACVRGDKISVTIAQRYIHFYVGGKAASFIRRFDEGGGVEPKTFRFKVTDVAKVPEHTDERKRQINLARNMRRAEGRPDKVYHYDPQRLRTTKDAKAKVKASKRDAEAA